MKIISVIFLVFTLSGCSGTKNQYKIEQEETVSFKEAYYQEWVAGVEGGGSGLNIYLEPFASDSNVELKGIYFRENYTELRTKKENSYHGFIRGEVNWKEEDNKENQEVEIPFSLKKNEAVVSFLQKGKLKYIKIELPEKKLEMVPQ